MDAMSHICMDPGKSCGHKVILKLQFNGQVVQLGDRCVAVAYMENDVSLEAGLLGW